MAWLKNRWCRGPLLLGVLGLLAVPARAQTPLPTGDGILGEYYDGPDFDRLVTRRRDATLAFDWGHAPPVPGVPAEYFSVRWTGWLVPPASGRYVLHATVDDGIRIWLNDKLVMNEWRPQPVRTFTTSVELKAGEPYKLRVDYYQDILDTSMRITWERPDVPLKPPAPSLGNLWGRMAETPRPEPIPMSFLFANNPRPAADRPATTAVATRPLAAAIPLPPKVAVATKPRVAPTPASPAPIRPQVTALPTRRPALPAPPAAKPPVAESNVLLADSGSTAKLAHLAVGEAVTLPELYFDQGQSRLLPPTRAALDKLAAVLSAQPALRLEVQGHTDNVGSAELNRQLSQQRAEAVCLYLTAHGVAMARLRPVGYGSTRPVADNTDPAQRPRNRRVVLRRL